MLTGKRITLIVTVIMMVGLLCILLLNGVGSISIGVAKENKMEDLREALLEQDIGLYVIGDVPDGLLDLGTKISSFNVNEENMPIWVSQTHSRITNGNGYVISESVPRDYPEHMLLMVCIPADAEVEDETWEIIRNCAVENNVPVLLVGSHNIVRFREYLIQASKVYEENDTMLFTSPDHWTVNPFGPLNNTHKEDFSAAFMEYWLERIAPDGN